MEAEKQGPGRQEENRSGLEWSGHTEILGTKGDFPSNPTGHLLPDPKWRPQLWSYRSIES